MKTKRIAINGLGRIGRLVLRKLIYDGRLEIVALNDTVSFETISYLLKYSSEHGAFDRAKSVQYDEGRTQGVHPQGSHLQGDYPQGECLQVGYLTIDNINIPTFNEPDASKLPWEELAVDLVIDSTGAYTSRSKAQAHVDAGAKKVLISAAAGKDVPTVVYSLNENTLKSSDTIISGASCSTVGLAPLANALNHISPIEHGISTTIHAFTPTQMVLDNPQAKGNLRRSRTASTNIIPTSAAAAQAVGLVIPDLAGKLSGSAIRVPVTQGSLITLYAAVKSDSLTVESLNNAMASETTDLFAYTDDELVSSDIAGTEFESIFDATQTKVSQSSQGRYLVEVAAWFDNETSYISHFTQLISYICNEIN